MYVCQADIRKMMNKMVGTLKYMGSTLTDEEKTEKTAAMDIYTKLTTPQQRHSFCLDFFSPSGGAGGKNLKALLTLQRSISAKDDTEISSTSDYITRHSSGQISNTRFNKVKTQIAEIQKSKV
jgi:hypothetical protein